jgi:hypothetical protein
MLTAMMMMMMRAAPSEKAPYSTHDAPPIQAREA